MIEAVKEDLIRCYGNFAFDSVEIKRTVMAIDEI